jgi:hypothetical protein
MTELKAFEWKLTSPSQYMGIRALCFDPFVPLDQRQALGDAVRALDWGSAVRQFAAGQLGPGQECKAVVGLGWHQASQPHFTVRLLVNAGR